MPINTRSKKREPVNAFVEFAVNGSSEKTVKLNIPKESMGAGTKGSIKATLLDISVVGCAIESPYIIPPGVLLHIKIDSKPFTAEVGGDRKELLKMTGSVRSCVMKQGGHYRLGIQFEKIDKQDADLIDNFIKIMDRRKAPRWNMEQPGK